MILPTFGRVPKAPRDPRELCYFIQEGTGGRVKIGYSVDPQNRMKEFQTGNSNVLILVGLVEGGQPTEAKLHKKFRRYHHRGEWFWPHRSMVPYAPQLTFVEEQYSKGWSLFGRWIISFNVNRVIRGGQDA
jgi:hypothetical protein